MPSTVLIGLDGATFRVLDPLCDDGQMPFMARFRHRAARCVLRSTTNPFTPPAWTTVVTGRSPGEHGIFDFARVTWSDGIPRSKLATARDVGVETLWSLVSRAGLRVNTLNFPLSYPPRPISGNLVPGFVRWRHLRHSVHPPELYDALCSLPGFDRKELAMDWDLERKALKALPRGEYESWIRFHHRRERQWMRIVRHLDERDPADLLAVLFDGVDKLQHLCWRFIDPELLPERPDPWEARIADLCRQYFRQLDGFLEEIVERAGPEAQVIVVSDHGFGDTTEILYVNAWLAREGHLAWAEGAEARDDDQLNVDGHADPSSLFDWERTTACALTAGSMGIYIRQATAPGRPGVPPAEYEAYRDRLADGLLGITDGAGEAVVRAAVKREEAFPGAYVDRAPDLTLILRDGGTLSVLNSSEVVRKRTDVAGTHRPDGIFLAAGPGFRSEVRVEPLSIVDVAPTVLYALGLPIPENFEGRLPVEILDPAWTSRHPLTIGAPTRTPAAFPGSPEDETLGADEEALIMRRLKALGYVG